MIPTKTIINCLREYAKGEDFHLRRIMLEAAKKLEQATAKSPCDLCRFNPPSSGDGKPCTMCVAEGRTE